MATRLFLTRGVTLGGPTPTPRGAWDQTASAVVIGLDAQKAGGGNSIAIAETSPTTLWDVLLGSLVTGSLAAQTVSGTLSYALALSESTAAANCYTHLHVWVMTAAGAVRGTLLTDAVESLTQEWSTSLSADGRVPAAPLSLSSVALSAADRIVIEVGYRAENTDVTSYTGRLRFGGARDLPDLASGGGGGTAVGWVEFSTDLVFAPSDEARLGQLTVEVVGLAAAPARPTTRVVLVG